MTDTIKKFSYRELRDEVARLAGVLVQNGVEKGDRVIIYKDALSAIGNRGVTRHYPHTPGIDAAGVVAVSENEAFSAGDEVVVIGYDLGMNTAGGFGQYIRVPAEWVVKLPASLTESEPQEAADKQRSPGDELWNGWFYGGHVR